MADCVPFVNSGNDLRRLRGYYDRPIVGRVSLNGLPTLRRRGVQRTCDLWIDPEIDGYHQLLDSGDVWPDWKTHISQFAESGILADHSFIQKPDLSRLEIFVSAVMEECRKNSPAWISVPQLPVVAGSGRNKINTALARATASWKEEYRFTGRLVLPLIFTHQTQLKNKTHWRPKLDLAKKCFDSVGPDIIWAVDSDLSDWRGSERFRDRFASLVAFHSDLREYFPHAKIIAGPYWGMNLVLWTRGLCDYPAITLGYGFAYRISGGYRGMEPTATIALSPLRRLARATEELRTWLNATVEGLSQAETAREEFSLLKGNFEKLKNYEIARDQVAESYSEWVKKLAATSASGRSLTLYQDLSSAYVLGKQLHKLPRSEAPGTDAGKVAEQLMLYCL
jgi:hypothetical protein